MTVTDAQLLGWIQQYAWAFVRIGGLLMVAPVLGSRQVTVRVRLMLVLALTILIAPLLPQGEVLEMFSGAWFRTLFQQLLTGIALGFTLQLVFEGVMLGGELIANVMGLGFAQMADPVRGVSSPVVGQFLMVLATLIFLALGGHLLLIELLAGSFSGVPVSRDGLSTAQLSAIVQFGGEMFVGGVRLALPVMIAMLLVNLGFGAMSRAAPSLNLMSVGFPAALIAGLFMLHLALPALLAMFQASLEQGWLLLGQLAGSGS